MRRVLCAMLMGAAALATIAAAPAHTASLTVKHAWSRATPPGASVGVAYFEILNDGAADVLTSIETPAAQRVEMHSTTMKGGLMQMRRTEAVTIPAGGRLAFEPNGLHAMLVDLKSPLQEGARLTLTLTFRQAGKVDVLAVVQGFGAESTPVE